ncbi:MAG: DUF559 domain-containing protein [Patescibacteria group bacterium]
MVKVRNIVKLKNRRRTLRREGTKEENLLWWHVKGSRLGHKIRRQYSLGGYVVDFCCSTKKLVIELDGSVHNAIEAVEYDIIRDKYLKELGYTVLRFPNWKVDKNIDEVLNQIKLHLR